MVTLITCTASDANVQLKCDCLLAKSRCLSLDGSCCQEIQERCVVSDIPVCSVTGRKIPFVPDVSTASLRAHFALSTLKTKDCSGGKSIGAIGDVSCLVKGCKDKDSCYVCQQLCLGLYSNRVYPPFFYRDLQLGLRTECSRADVNWTACKTVWTLLPVCPLRGLYNPTRLPYQCSSLNSLV